MIVRRWAMAAGLLPVLAGTAHADRCAVTIANGTGDVLVSVTVRAQFAPPGSEADRNLPLTLPAALRRGQSAPVAWDCPSGNISYVATGTFANGITRSSTPFRPRPFLSGALDTAWIE